jgi:hypothetical protein
MLVFMVGLPRPVSAYVAKCFNSCPLCPLNGDIPYKEEEESKTSGPIALQA